MRRLTTTTGKQWVNAKGEKHLPHQKSSFVIEQLGVKRETECALWSDSLDRRPVNNQTSDRFPCDLLGFMAPMIKIFPPSGWPRGNPEWTWQVTFPKDNEASHGISGSLMLGCGSSLTFQSN